MILLKNLLQIVVTVLVLMVAIIVQAGKVSTASPSGSTGLNGRLHLSAPFLIDIDGQVGFDFQSAQRFCLDRNGRLPTVEEAATIYQNYPNIWVMNKQEFDELLQKRIKEEEAKMGRKVSRKEWASIVTYLGTTRGINESVWYEIVEGKRVTKGLYVNFDKMSDHLNPAGDMKPEDQVNFWTSSSAFGNPQQRYIYEDGNLSSVEYSYKANPYAYMKQIGVRCMLPTI